MVNSESDFNENSFELIQKKSHNLILRTGQIFKVLRFKLIKDNKNRRKKMKDLTVILENSPGKFADLGELLGKNDINMEGVCGIPLNDEAFIHILVEDATKVRSILEQAGYQVTAEREVLVLTGRPGINVLGQPGAGGRIARKIGNAGVNIELIYFAGLNRLVIGADDLEKAKAALE